jgi:hypothetical protein
MRTKRNITKLARRFLSVIAVDLIGARYTTLKGLRSQTFIPNGESGGK